LTTAHNELLHKPTWLEETDIAKYAEFILESDEDAENTLRSATRTGRPFGSEAFIDNMEFQLKTILRPRKPGRPTKTRECSE